MTRIRSIGENLLRQRSPDNRIATAAFVPDDLSLATSHLLFTSALFEPIRIG